MVAGRLCLCPPGVPLEASLGAGMIFGYQCASTGHFVSITLLIFLKPISRVLARFRYIISRNEAVLPISTKYDRISVKMHCTSLRVGLGQKPR